MHHVYLFSLGTMVKKQNKIKVQSPITGIKSTTVSLQIQIELLTR